MLGASVPSAPLTYPTKELAKALVAVEKVPSDERSTKTVKLSAVGDIMLWIREKMNMCEWHALRKYLHDDEIRDHVRGSVAEDEFIHCRIVVDDYVCQADIRAECEIGNILGVVGNLNYESANIVSLDVALNATSSLEASTSKQLGQLIKYAKRLRSMRAAAMDDDWSLVEFTLDRQEGSGGGHNHNYRSLMENSEAEMTLLRTEVQDRNLQKKLIDLLSIPLFKGRTRNSTTIGGGGGSGSGAAASDSTATSTAASTAASTTTSGIRVGEMRNDDVRLEELQEEEGGGKMLNMNNGDGTTQVQMSIFSRALHSMFLRVVAHRTMLSEVLRHMVMSDGVCSADIRHSLEIETTNLNGELSELIDSGYLSSREDILALIDFEIQHSRKEMEEMKRVQLLREALTTGAAHGSPSMYTTSTITVHLLAGIVEGTTTSSANTNSSTTTTATTTTTSEEETSTLAKQTKPLMSGLSAYQKEVRGC